MDLYYNRPAAELIFLTQSEHRRLHSTGENNPFFGHIGLSGSSHPNFKEVDIQKIFEMRDCGYSLSNIAEEFNVSITVIKNRLRDFQMI